ncbi:hypothetical protein PG993_004231 [Apiospora rasikravindrae]|uniref:Uncharacterized protein n=1 Tax=Apiospora rasikravindrae TaxID=990691 RepID=A0ABR1TC69_9PEZI
MQNSPLERSLLASPIPEPTVSDLKKWLWGSTSCNPLNPKADSQPYFDFYSSKCLEYLTDGGRNVFQRTHADVVNISDRILRGDSREDILAYVTSFEAGCQTSYSRCYAEHSVDLCATLLTMTDVGECTFKLSMQDFVAWTTGPLRNALTSHFVPTKSLGARDVKLDGVFTAPNLTRIGGIRILWTSNLANHLRLTEDDTAVFIYHHASFLKMYQSVGGTLYPSGFVEETLRTLALLFPQSDRTVSSWLRSVDDDRSGVDLMVAKCGTLRSRDRRFERFLYWHDRLVILKQAFDDAKPRKLSQWWWDRRDGVQWYTFWVAVLVFALTLFFGLVQSIEGGMQVYLSYKSMQ